MSEETGIERRRVETAMIIVVAALAAVLVVLTYRDFGITWDEGMQARYGEQARDYFRSGLREPPLDNRGLMRYCGTLVEMVPAFVYGDDTDFELRHLWLGGIALLGVPGLVLLCRITGKPWMTLAAVVALLTMPRFVGHAVANSKDMPFAVGVIWSMWSLAAIAATRDLRWRRLVTLGVVLGLTLCVRPGGGPILLAYGAMAATLAWGVRPPDATKTRWAASCLKLGVVVAIAWIVMVLPWPWAHEAPVAHPLAAMRAAGGYPVELDILFDGQVRSSHALPRRYLAEYLLITTPPGHLLLAGVGIVFAALAWRDRASRGSAFIGALAAGWLLLPVTAFAVLRPHTHDGLRHFLFVLPAIAVLAGVGVAGIVTRVRGRRVALAAGIAAGVILLASGRHVVRLHPYQYTYFNGLAGGLAGAEGRFETDYWVASYREAMTWINDRAGREPEDVFHVLVGGNRSLSPAASYFAGPNVRTSFVDPGDLSRVLPPDVDYAILTTRFGEADRYPDSPAVHVVGRDGAVFTVIRGRVPAPP